MGKENGSKKERVIMLASSALVLTALTATGIFMQTEEKKAEDKGYVLDFTALNDTPEEPLGGITLSAGKGAVKDKHQEKIVTDNDLDYMPLEVDSNQIEIGRKDTVKNEGTLSKVTKKAETPAVEEVLADGEETVPVEAITDQTVGVQEQTVSVPKQLHFEEQEGLLRPVPGAVLLPYSMNSSIYFTTLDQFKYNPAVVIGANENDVVAVAADGRVTAIYDDPEIGHAVAVDIGDGYTLTYGQMKNVNFGVGDFVGCGQALGTIAAPTKYYTAEGANLYLNMTKDGASMDPEELFRY